jgi:3-hydroxyacyl-CoA dehydrogenase
MLSSIKSYTRNSENPGFYSPLLNKLEELVRLNRLGIKNKSGFYEYSQPAEEMPINADTDKDHEAYKNTVTKRLWDYYSSSISSVLESGVCTKDELKGYIKDYLGTDNDPFILNN